jgi:KTSC domain
MKKVFTLCVLLALCLGPAKAAVQGAQAPDVHLHKIARVPVESESIDPIGYSRLAKVLEIELRNGRICQKLGVSGWRHRKFMRAESKGSFSSPKFAGITNIGG